MRKEAGILNSIWIFIIGVNAITFILMGVDKRKAVRNQYRIPERTFWALSILGGAIGSYIGMQTFRHKTKHTSFMVGIPILIAVNIVLFVWLFSA